METKMGKLFKHSFAQIMGYLMALFDSVPPIGIIITEVEIHLQLLMMPFRSPNSKTTYVNAILLGPYRIFKTPKKVNIHVLSLILAFGNTLEDGFRLPPIQYVDLSPGVLKSRVCLETTMSNLAELHGQIEEKDSEIRQEDSELRQKDLKIQELIAKLQQAQPEQAFDFEPASKRRCY